MIVGPREMPQWVADMGFHVFYDGIAGAWIAAHLEPKYGDHGANYAAYATQAEAILRCIQEASQ